MLEREKEKIKVCQRTFAFVKKNCKGIVPTDIAEF